MDAFLIETLLFAAIQTYLIIGLLVLHPLTFFNSRLDELPDIFQNESPPHMKNNLILLCIDNFKRNFSIGLLFQCKSSF